MKNIYSSFLVLLLITSMSLVSLAEEKISNAIDPINYFIKHSNHLEDLTSKLTQFSKASIVGTSGMGKTQFARTYAKDNQDKYEIIWFIDNNLNQNEEFLSLAKAINKKQQSTIISEDIKLVKQEVMSYLTTRNKWLIVFDNIKSGENAKLQDVISWAHNGHIIFASQSSEYLPNIVKLKPLKKEDAIKLAKKILNDQNDENATFIAKEFNGYPIMIVQSAHLLNNIKGLNKEEYKNKLYGIDDKVKFNVTLALSKLSSTSKNLVNRIALINNQGFSKNFLKYITDHPDTLEEDIYELANFMLINDINNKSKDPVFAMHDVIALKIQELLDFNTKQFLLERIVDNLGKNTPSGAQNAYVFRTSSMINDNVQVMLKNIDQYPINIYKEMELRLYMMEFYDSSRDKKDRDWFLNKKKQNAFDPQQMTENNIYVYCHFLNIIAGDHLINYDLDNAIKYSEEARHLAGMISNIEKHTAIKLHSVYQLSRAYILKADFQQAQEYVDILENLFTDKIAKSSDIGYLLITKARFAYMKGEYEKALEFINQDIAESRKYGLEETSRLFFSTYIIKFNTLHKLKRYKDARKYIDLLKNMYLDPAENKREGAIVYSKLAEQLLMENNIKEAKETIIKSIKYFHEYSETEENFDLSINMYYSRANVIYGDILLKENNKTEALQYYNKALEAPKNQYRDNIDNMHFVKLLKDKINKLQYTKNS